MPIKFLPLPSGVDDKHGAYLRRIEAILLDLDGRASSRGVSIAPSSTDNFFEADLNGDLMPRVNPTSSYTFEIDIDGNITPRL